MVVHDLEALGDEDGDTGGSPSDDDEGDAGLSMGTGIHRDRARQAEDPKKVGSFACNCIDKLVSFFFFFAGGARAKMVMMTTMMMEGQRPSVHLWHQAAVQEVCLSESGEGEGRKCRCCVRKCFS